MRRAAALLALSLAACGAPPAVELDGALRPTAQGECPDNVCLSDPDADARADARAALAACVVDDTAPEPDAADALRLSRIEVVADEAGALTLHVALANVASQGVMTYPGIVVEIVDGEARFTGDLAAGASATVQLYGILACSETELVVPLAFDDDDGFSAATLAVSATDHVGSVEVDAAVVEVRRVLP